MNRLSAAAFDPIAIAWGAMWPLAARAQHSMKVRRIGYLELGSADSIEPHFEAFRRGLADLGWVENRSIVLAGARDAADLKSAFAALADAKVEAFAMLPDGMFLTQRDLIIGLAAQNRLPALYGVLEFAQEGGFMAYGANLTEMFRSGATFADRILRGAKPADLPVEQPTTFELIINTKTAKALGVTIPPSVLIQAGRVIE